MAAIILNNALDGKSAEIIQDDSGENMVFSSVEEADTWCWENSRRLGSAFRIIDLDD